MASEVKKTIRISEEMDKRIKEMASARNVSESSLINIILFEAVMRNG